MMQRCVASISRGQSLSMARRWLPALAQRDFATAQRKGMRIGFFSAHNYEIGAMKALADHAGIAKDNELVFFSNRLTQQTTQLAENCDGVCIFVNDVADATVLRRLYDRGTRVLFLRCAGFDMVDLDAAKELNMPVLPVVGGSVGYEL
ncbi:2-hydroxyacid dehydrogenase-like protein [Phytophthora ramorum]|nr:2-hydroxyacid dehydrogenase-like protein [Phytophthora ramorum]